MLDIIYAYAMKYPQILEALIGMLIVSIIKAQIRSLPVVRFWKAKRQLKKTYKRLKRTGKTLSKRAVRQLAKLEQIQNAIVDLELGPTAQSSVPEDTPIVELADEVDPDEGSAARLLRARASA